MYSSISTGLHEESSVYIMIGFYNPADIVLTLQKEFITQTCMNTKQLTIVYVFGLN